MSKNLFFATIAALAILGCSVPLWAQCPEDTCDPGICDTMYVEAYDCDQGFTGEPRQVRVPIRVTNDIPDPTTDSVAAFQIPLCFTSTNPAAGCTLDPLHNHTSFLTNPDGCIFRHLPSWSDPQEHNWIADLEAQGLVWNTMILRIEDQHFWLTLLQGSASEAPDFCGGSRVLLATMTFTVDDTTTICIDSCQWPPAGGLVFGRDDAVTFVPRHNLPHCFSVVAQCPEQPVDNGICDTMYVEVYERDWLFSGEPSQARVPIRVTNDIPDPVIDSIAGMVIPLCFTTSNSGAQCFLDPLYNENTLWLCWRDRCIFRHLPSVNDPQEHNWMLDLWENTFVQEWDTRILDLGGGTHFWLSLVPTGTQDKRFCGGSRVLVATMTFTVDDTMTICLDTCFWPPTARLAFSRSDAVTYFPRTNLPYCFTMAHLGDCTGNNLVDIGDVVFLINYVFRSGVAPDPIEVGDANCDGIVDVGDVVRLIGYLYKGEPPPSC